MGSESQLVVEIFPAGLGDAILLRCVSGSERPINILVDGGVRATYERHLTKRLQELRAQGERLDLVIVTHIDTDHIGGILKLLRANGPAASPAVIEICDIWHNTYRHLRLQGREPTEPEKQKVLSQVADADGTDGLPGEISVREGDTLARLISEGGYPWNKGLGGDVAVAGKSAVIGARVELTLLSPGPENLESLGDEWQKRLQSMGVSFEAVKCPEFEEAFEKEVPRIDAEMASGEAEISAYSGCEPPDPSTFEEDASVTNGSSIAFLLEFAGIKALFLGDSWPSVILNSWEKLPAEKRTGVLALVKVSHHGSRHNTSPDLANKITAKNYVVSTDGSKHGHPNLEALLWVADGSRGATRLVFNYPTGSAARMDQGDAKGRFGHQVVTGTGTEAVSLTLADEVARGGPES